MRRPAGRQADLGVVFSSLGSLKGEHTRGGDNLGVVGAHLHGQRGLLPDRLARLRVLEIECLICARPHGSPAGCQADLRRGSRARRRPGAISWLRALEEDRRAEACRTRMRDVSLQCRRSSCGCGGGQPRVASKCGRQCSTRTAARARGRRCAALVVEGRAISASRLRVEA